MRSKIGGGGMGEVYLAVDTELDRTVAIKILPESLPSASTVYSASLEEVKGRLGFESSAHLHNPSSMSEVSR